MALVQVKSNVDNLSVGDKVLMKGESGDCPADRAKYLAQRGLVEIAGADKPGKGTAAEHAVHAVQTRAEHQTKKG